MSSELEQRVAALEKKFAEVEKAKGVPGPRGPAGDISAAVRNAEDAARKVVGDARQYFAPVVQELKTALSAIQKANTDGQQESAEKVRVTIQKFDDLFKAKFANIEHEIANRFIPLLQEYHLLDENCSPTHWKK